MALDVGAKERPANHAVSLRGLPAATFHLPEGPVAVHAAPVVLDWQVRGRAGADNHHLVKAGRMAAIARPDAVVQVAPMMPPSTCSSVAVM